MGRDGGEVHHRDKGDQRRRMVLVLAVLVGTKNKIVIALVVSANTLFCIHFLSPASVIVSPAAAGSPPMNEIDSSDNICGEGCDDDEMMIYLSTLKRNYRETSFILL